MAQQAIYQGRTNNHINWVMVDATDFATPESALSAATKIKIYGQLRSATGTNFVSSGTGSLTNDITHVGASALGIYHIALAKADISDASAALYDTYIISLSATGAAYQMLVLPGLRDDDSYVSNVLSYLSNMASNLSGIVSDIRSGTSDTNSKLVVMSGILSDAYSALVALSDATSNAYSAAVVGASRILVVQSRVSDIGSQVWAEKYTANSAASTFGSLMSDIYSRAGGAVTASDISDIASAVWATALATKMVQLNTSDLSDLRSAIAAGPAATVTASDISDIASAVADILASRLSDILSAAVQTNSRVLVAQSAASDAASGVTVLLSRVTKAVATASFLSDAHSDLRSQIGGITVTVTASDMSDIASRVWAEKYTAASNVKASTFGSALRLNMSRISDTQSYLAVMSGILSDTYSAVSDFQSDFQSRVPKAVATNSQLSDLHSDLRSYLVGISGAVSDAHSAAAIAASAASDAYSALSANRAEPAQGAPAASTTALAKIDYLYKAWRNRTTQTASQYSVYGDDALTIDHKATFSDDGTTADRAEVATGP